MFFVIDIKSYVVPSNMGLDVVGLNQEPQRRQRGTAAAEERDRRGGGEGAATTAESGSRHRGGEGHRGM